MSTCDRAAVRGRGVPSGAPRTRTAWRRAPRVGRACSRGCQAEVATPKWRGADKTGDPSRMRLGAGELQAPEAAPAPSRGRDCLRPHGRQPRTRPRSRLGRTPPQAPGGVPRAGHSPVGAADAVPPAGGEEGLVHALNEGFGHGAPGHPEGTHPAAAEGGAGSQPGLPGLGPQGAEDWGRGLLSVAVGGTFSRNHKEEPQPPDGTGSCPGEGPRALGRPPPPVSPAHPGR